MTNEKRLIDLLREDFAAGREIEVLGIKVFVKRLTIGEQMKINAMYPDDSAAQFVAMLTMKCRDADGKPIFTADDRDTLKEAVAGDRLTPVITAITGPPAEAQVKNSEAIG